MPRRGALRCAAFSMLRSRPRPRLPCRLTEVALSPYVAPLPPGSRAPSARSGWRTRTAQRRPSTRTSGVAGTWSPSSTPDAATPRSARPRWPVSASWPPGCRRPFPGQDVGVVGISYDPGYDTPERMRAYGTARRVPFSETAAPVPGARRARDPPRALRPHRRLRRHAGQPARRRALPGRLRRSHRAGVGPGLLDRRGGPRGARVLRSDTRARTATGMTLAESRAPEGRHPRVHTYACLATMRAHLVS